MELKYIWTIVLYVACGIIAVGWWHQKTSSERANLSDYVLVFFGYPFVLLFKFGQLLAK